MEQKLDIIKCYKEAWQSFKVHPGLAIGGVIIYYVLAFSGQIAEYSGAPAVIQLLYLPMNFLLMPALLIGITVLTLNLAGVAQPGLQDLLAGFNIYWKTLGLYWLYMLIVAGLMMPGVIILTIVMVTKQSNPMLLIVLGSIYFVLIVIVMIRWLLVFYVLADESKIGVVECLDRSSQITKGNRLRLVGLLLLTVPLTLIGLLALGVGIFVSMPIAMIAHARAYLWLKSFHPPLNATSTDQIVS